MKAQESLLTRISGMQFSTSEKRVIELLLSVAEYDVAGLSSSEIAQRTETSRSTVDRLCKRLGYRGLKELRRALLFESQGMRMPVATSRAEAIEKADSFTEIAYKVFHSASVRSLRFADLLSQSDDLDRLINAIRKAKSIQVFGVGGSAVVALDMHQRLMRLGIKVSFSEDHHNQIAGASLMEPDDLAIAISYSGRTSQTVQAARIARERGAMLAAVLGLPGSTLAELVDIPIILPPGINLFGADAVMTRALELSFNEVIFHCLAFGNAEMMQKVSQIEEILRGQKGV